MEPFEHKLQKFDPGIVWLDRHNRVIALNGVASRVLNIAIGQTVGNEIARVLLERNGTDGFLLDSGVPPPMTMMTEVPDRVLLTKVSTMWAGNEVMGSCVVFCDLTDVTTRPAVSNGGLNQRRQLLKLPVYKNGKVVLLDLNEVVHFKAEGHYTGIFTEAHDYLCSLSLADLETRLDATRFVRVHRSHMINVRFASAFEKVDDQCTIVVHGRDDVHIPVSRSNVPRLKEMFGLT